VKAFIVDRYKSNSALRLGEMPEPEVRDHDVLVAIHAASLNQPDAKMAPQATRVTARTFE
jgi:NADPH:quinone reductase-like Zn-dependent oxidoreductase